MIDITALQIESLPSVVCDKLRSLPHVSAIYFAVGEGNVVLYIGRSVDLNKRWIGGHHGLRSMRKHSFRRVHWLVVDREELEHAEAAALSHFSPALNVCEPYHGDLQADLEAVFYKFYGNLDGQYIEQQKRT